ncbi:MAG TPA: hypothetical protein DDY98_04490, partial [Ruminococcaceae bacterium]|nr:hypothetical protein [Oscillospiraceae bacterium]
MKHLKRLISAILVAILLITSNGLLAVNAVPDKTGQNKIVERTPLLNDKGELTEPGYCVTNLYDYDRSQIKANATRIKEWDFYQVSNERYLFQLTVADISLGGAITVYIRDMQENVEYSTMKLRLFTFGKMNLSKDAMKAHSYHYDMNNFKLDLNVTDTERTIKFKGKASGKDFDVDLKLAMLPNHESLVMAVPFDTKDNKHFYYNQKVNCMATTGTVKVGKIDAEFKGAADDSYCVLDWGRGVWPYHEVWWWGNGSKTVYDGQGKAHTFGWEIGWGFGDMSAATENTLFYDGKAHKIGTLKLVNESEVVKKWDKCKWIITDGDEGRFY